jgi:hypothetical protein
MVVNFFWKKNLKIALKKKNSSFFLKKKYFQNTIQQSNKN